MSRSYRTSEDDLAYGDTPQRWDRDRFERAGRGPPSRFEEDFEFRERDRPGRRDVEVIDRVDERGPGGRFAERDRFWEHDRTASRPRRRTDRELFGDVDPREIAEMSLTKYRRAPSRPGLLRRQSSLDSYDRRPMRYEREEYRLPPYQPIPLPVHRERYFEPEDYKEVEITRERSVRRRGPTRSRSRSGGRSRATEEDMRSEHRSVKSKKSRAKSRVSSSSSSSSSESASQISKEQSIRESIVDIKRKFKRGKTRMPKRLVRREAIMDLAYPFDEEEHFFVLKVALEKEQIDEVIKISESYKNGAVEEKTMIKIEDTSPDPPRQDREEVIRTEWINPPSQAGRGRRSRSARPPSPSNFSISTRRESPPRTLRLSRSRTRSRAPSATATLFSERKTVVETSPGPPGPPPPEFFNQRRTVIEERPESVFPGHQSALIIKDRDHRSARDIQAEIRALEFEKRALRLERKSDRDLSIRVREPLDPDYPILTMREARPIVVENFDRDRSPSRNIIRLDRDRKGRRDRRRARSVALAMATLT